jgi:hypothetical protein
MTKIQEGTLLWKPSAGRLERSHLTRYMKWLAERGHDVTLLTAAAYEPEGRAVPPRVKIVKKIARVTHRLSALLPARVLGLARKIEAIVDACVVAFTARRLRPHVIHLHCTNQIALAYLILLRQTGVPVVVTAHVVTAHERTRFQDAVRYGRSHRQCFDYLQEVRGTDAHQGLLARAVKGSPGSLDGSSNRFRGADLNHVFDRRKIHSEIERRGGDHETEEARLNAFLHPLALIQIQRAVMQGHGLGPLRLSCHNRLIPAFGMGARVGKDQGALKRIDTPDHLGQ